MAYVILPNGSVRVQCGACPGLEAVHDSRPIRLLVGWIKVKLPPKTKEEELSPRVVTIPLIKRFEDSCLPCQHKAVKVYRPRDRK